jgi:methylenetetrahydrofolate dehydrogenase (NADP+)/methenyltetrahydrofolate cyclohydrolase
LGREKEGSVAVLLNGGELSRKLRGELKARSVDLRKAGLVPCLAVILVGDNPASLSYVGAKEKALEEAEMGSRDFRLPAETSQGELLSLIAELNADPLVHGILVQLPLPPHINEDLVINAIDPAKDVDGFHPVSVGNMVLGRPGFLPCTPHGVVVLLREYQIPLAGAHAVVLGRSNIVGKPLANLLARRDLNATVTLCHTGTRNLAALSRTADILISAVGKPGTVGADMVKEGAAVIDVGVNRVPDSAAKRGYRLRGDVDFEPVSAKAGFITPVPGGVGPMTITMLLQNVVLAAEARKGRNPEGRNPE